ncbi:putative all-trans-retinol dehydrogenase (NAD(+)) [Rosa chinensis]|uniref:Putative all-trans-retinol dehydrogenase (NAD(+)) n=1 Tax=Rosa chinensis TaxID=74649 RepID=A0A2P6RPA9_ROSCH|nr:putative all-trans-retinol dehydrogenase (NAD(+)) [Rosa chinensis]
MASWLSGSIVNIGSIVGKAPNPWAGSYCASKAYVHAVSNTLRVELKPFGIDVALVMPGAVRSNFGSANVDRLANHDWKLYKDFKEAIAERVAASQGGKATEPSVFARHVAKKVLGPKPPRLISFAHMTGCLLCFLALHFG